MKDKEKRCLQCTLVRGIRIISLTFDPEDMMQSKVLFIGGGNMAASLIGGLLADGHPHDALHVVEPDEDRREKLQLQFDVGCSSPESGIEKDCDILVLAIKPQIMPRAAAQWRDYVLRVRPVVLSIAAGINTEDLSRWLGGYEIIVRAMPNTPALIQAGATGLYACPAVNEQGRATAETVLRAAGLTLWVEQEELIDAITAISGSGPAYFFLYMEALQEAGVALGLDARTSHLLTLQTALGAARMALESPDDVNILRERVTSPGGTTERALNQFNDDDLRGIVKRATSAAAKRARELAEELGKS